MAKDAEEIQDLVDGMRAGDARAMESFFTFVDGLKAKKLGKDGNSALTVIVSVVVLLLPVHARFGLRGRIGQRREEASATKAGAEKEKA